MGTWTDQGFVAKPLQYYVDELRRIFTEAFGDDFILDETTPQGVLITRLAQLLFNTDMDGVEAFSRLNISSAGGFYLDLIGNLRGVTRILGSPQLVSVQITSSAGTGSGFLPYTIPHGTVFKSLSQVDTFFNERNITVQSETQTVTLRYGKNGDSSVLVNDKLQVNGIVRITDVTILSLIPGMGNETDVEYRRRLLTEKPALNNTIKSVENKLFELPTVKSVGSQYNDTAQTVGQMPPYTTEWMVVPKEGANQTVFKNSVAETIINNKVPGSPTYGNTTVTVEDVFGDQKTVSFTVAEKRNLQIDIKVVTPEATGRLDLINVPKIRQDMYNYINGLMIGKDVSYSRCCSSLFADTGFDVDYFKIKEEGDTTWIENGNYIINERQYAAIDFESINIHV